MFNGKRISYTMLVLCVLACKKPTENVKIVVDTDIIKYTAMINVTDAATGNPAPSNAIISISGTEAANIYEVSGKKDIRLTGGMVAIGLHPNLVPESGKPIVITVSINVSGYNTATKQITFTAETKQQVVNIPITKTGSTTPPIVIPPPPVYQNVSLVFTGYCTSKPDVQIRPSVYVYFKKSNSSAAYQYLGYMDKGNITTNLLALNETYDFQIAYGGENYNVSQKIEQTSYNLTINMGNACNF
jgi:hypothetical protein